MLHLVALRKNVKTNTEMFGNFVNSTCLFVIFVYKSKCLWQYMQFSKVLLIRVLGMFLVLLFILRQFSILCIIIYCIVGLQKYILFQMKSGDSNLQMTQLGTLQADISLCKFNHLEVEL